MSQNTWKIGPDDKSIWAQFGLYQLQGVRADNSFEDGFSACVQIVDTDGNTVAELEIEGDPSLQELGQRAVKFAADWLNELNEALTRIAR